MFCSGLNKYDGNFEDITGMIADGLENSGFFHALNQNQKKETPKKTKATAQK